MDYSLEICANSVQSAINAQQGGAHRVELCDNLWEGGTTPSTATILLTRQHLNIDVYVLIRPRGGDFVYSELEFEIMTEDIKQSKKLGADGIVSGVLLPNGNIDITRTKELVELSKPLSFTFHRAFDLVNNLENALEDVISCGAERILTSGLDNSSIEGLDTLKKLNEYAKGRITIMPGGGITTENISMLAQHSSSTEFHCSAKAKVKNKTSVDTKVKMNSSSTISEEYRYESDPKVIAKIVQTLNEL